MNTQMRFGKKIPLPSTAQIKHELRLMIAADALAAAYGGQRILTMAEIAVIAGRRPPLE